MNMRTSSTAFLILILAFTCLTVVSAAQAKPAPGQKPAAAIPTPESVANGAALFKRHCVMCHGATGVGDGPAAKTLKGKLPSLADKTVMSKLTDAQIHETITTGKKTEVGNMPALGKRLKPEEITDIVNFVRTLGK
jgi:cbb3-type cytochrome c oxidase subunit III